MQKITHYRCWSCSCVWPEYLPVCPQCQTEAGLRPFRAVQTRKVLKRRVRRRIPVYRAPAVPEPAPLSTDDAPIPLSQISYERLPRFPTGIEAFDEVMKGGLVRGKIYMITGEPGAGKTTFTFQLAAGIARTLPEDGVLIFEAEMNAQDVMEIADRVNAIDPPNLHLMTSRFIEDLLEMTVPKNPGEKTRYQWVVLDSIQMMESQDPHVMRMAEAARWTYIAHRVKEELKPWGTAVIIISQINSDGHAAGEKKLEHGVDCAMFLKTPSGQREDPKKMLVFQKTRLGCTHPTLALLMTDHGLVGIDEQPEHSEPPQAPGTPP